ncbi:MAG: class I SAM-dependent methyltransferase [Planctomycetes bacterium]|nr:class I SAM-dependent methyltransferase [Planctomycetota bacterium]
MLPPDFSAFGFTYDAAGADAALAARTVRACRQHGATDIAVGSAHRWGLLVALASQGLAVTAYDPSRAVLATAKRGLASAGLESQVTLFANDPRDVEIPGGIGAALITSSLWRLLLHDEGQRSALRSLRTALRGPALLLLDVDRVPRLPVKASKLLRRGPGRQTWRIRRVGGDVPAVFVSCEAPGVATVEVAMSAGQPEDAARTIVAAGFDVLSFTAAATAVTATVRQAGPRSARVWIVARKRGT